MANVRYSPVTRELETQIDRLDTALASAIRRLEFAGETIKIIEDELVDITEATPLSDAAITAWNGGGGPGGGYRKRRR